MCDQKKVNRAHKRFLIKLEKKWGKKREICDMNLSSSGLVVVAVLWRLTTTRSENSGSTACKLRASATIPHFLSSYAGHIAHQSTSGIESEPTSCQAMGLRSRLLHLLSNRSIKRSEVIWMGEKKRHSALQRETRLTIFSAALCRQRVSSLLIFCHAPDVRVINETFESQQAS